MTERPRRGDRARLARDAWYEGWQNAHAGMDLTRLETLDGDASLETIAPEGVAAERLLEPIDAVGAAD